MCVLSTLSIYIFLVHLNNYKLLNYFRFLQIILVYLTYLLINSNTINWFIYNIKEAMPILTQPLDGFEKSRNHYALSRFI